MYILCGNAQPNIESGGEIIFTKYVNRDDPSGAGGLLKIGSAMEGLQEEVP